MHRRRVVDPYPSGPARWLRSQETAVPVETPVAPAPALVDDGRLVPAPRHRLGRASRAARLFQLLSQERNDEVRAAEDRVVVAELARWR